MQKRRGAILVMYDLPVTSNVNRKTNEKFRKYLIHHGYVFVQKSVYVKLVRSKRAIQQEISLLRKEVPKEGTVNVLPLKLEEFLMLETISGVPFHMKVFADDMVIL